MFCVVSELCNHCQCFNRDLEMTNMSCLTNTKKRFLISQQKQFMHISQKDFYGTLPLESQHQFSWEKLKIYCHLLVRKGRRFRKIKGFGFCFDDQKCEINIIKS